VYTAITAARSIGNSQRSRSSRWARADALASPTASNGHLRRRSRATTAGTAAIHHHSRWVCQIALTSIVVKNFDLRSLSGLAPNAKLAPASRRTNPASRAAPSHPWRRRASMSPTRRS
jgi:hypothetical protein